MNANLLFLNGISNTHLGNRGTIKHRKPFPCEGYAKPQNVGLLYIENYQSFCFIFDEFSII